MNQIIRGSKDSYPWTCDFLTRNYNFRDFYYSETSKPITSKINLLYEQIKSFFLLLFNIKIFRKSNIILSIGYTTLTLIFLYKLRLIRFNRIYWWGFFIHDTRYFSFFRILLRLLSTKKLYFIVFSEYEKKKYSEIMGIKDTNLRYVPYGDWNSAITFENAPGKTLDYYFSGGYSNRDYKKLIEAFRAIDKQLIIVCSKNNRDILEMDIPGNIKIFTDLASDEFDKYLRESKAVIIPFKYNSGASGQSVMLRCMRNRKPVIVTRTDSIEEYVDNGISGFVIDNLQDELAPMIERLENDQRLCSELGMNLYKKYTEKFSYKAIRPYLLKIISEG